MMQLRKQPPATPNQTPVDPMVSPTLLKPKQQAKIFGMEVRSLAAVAGLVLFLVLGMAGVMIALRQRQLANQTIAPNAPQSRPAASENNNASCALVFNVEGTTTQRQLTDCREAIQDSFATNTLSNYDITGPTNPAIEGSGTLSIANGVLSMLTASSGANTRAAFETKKAYQGDFTVDLDVSQLTSAQTDVGIIRLNFDELEATGSALNRTPYIEVYKKGGYYVRTNIAGLNAVSQASSPLLSSSAIALRVVRTGTNMEFFYKTASSSAYNSLVIYPDSGYPVSVRVATRHDDNDSATATTAGGQTTGRVNAFSLTCPTTTTTYSCNSLCTTTAQCASANAAYSCETIGTEQRCRLTSNKTSATCQSTTTVTYSCNAACDTDTQCQSANNDYVCTNTSGGKFCRLKTNTASTSCTPLTNTYACNSTCSSDANCQTANSNYVCVSTTNGNRCRLTTNTASESCQSATVIVPSGCNQQCVNNADCANPDHICQSGSCRLATYPSSSTCTPPGTTTTTTVTTPGTPSTPRTPSTPAEQTQPELPAELPQTGAEDLLKWVGPGVGALILGALALLFI